MIPRTGSIASNVGPAVNSTRLPLSTFGCAQAAIAAKMSSGSCIRPAPVSPQAWSPTPGVSTTTPSATRRATLRWLAALPHIWRFIAGATKSGQSRARVSVDSRSSAWPLAILARKSADAGATTMAFAPRERSMCPIPLAAPDAQRSVSTGFPESACSVIGVMNRAAPGVMTTFTTTFALTKRRVSSAALYAAMPPVMPSTIRVSGDVGNMIIRPADWARKARSLHCRPFRSCAMERG